MRFTTPPRTGSLGERRHGPALGYAPRVHPPTPPPSGPGTPPPYGPGASPQYGQDPRQQGSGQWQPYQSPGSWQQPPRPTPPRQTGLIILITLAVVVAVVAMAAIVATNLNSQRPSPVRTPPASWPKVTDFVPPKQEPPSNMPTPAPSDKQQDLGALTTKPTTVEGSGSVTLNYRRLVGNGTHLRFTCTGCDTDTWLIDQTRPWPLSGGPLPVPTEYEYVLDSVDPPATTTLYVKAAPTAKWTLVLTPFDSLPIAANTTLQGRDDRVVRVRSTSKPRLECQRGPWVKTFFKASGEAEYEVGYLLSDDEGGAWDVGMPKGTDTIVAIISCPGPWTLNVT